jgi:hypothetical protein
MNGSPMGALYLATDPEAFAVFLLNLAQPLLTLW